MKKKSMNFGCSDYEAPSAMIQTRFYPGILCESGNPNEVDAGEFDENEW